MFAIETVRDDVVLIRTEMGEWFFHIPSPALHPAEGPDGGIPRTWRDETANRPVRRSGDPERGDTPKAAARDLAAPVFLSLIVSGACNLSCGYCYLKSGNTARRYRSFMTDEVMRGGCASYLGWHRDRDLRLPSPDLFIDFTGGEPLLNFKIVENAVRYVRREAQWFAARGLFILTTNGTLLDPGTAAFLERERFAVNVSVDGDERTHDLWRKDSSGRGSHARLAESLDSIPAALRDRITAKITVGPGGAGLRERVRHLEELGIGHYSIDTAFLYGRGDGLWDEDSWRAYEESSFDYAVYCLDKITTSGMPPDINLGNRLSRVRSGRRKSSSCSVASTMTVLNTDGRFYPCHTLCWDPMFSIGSVDEGLDMEKRRRYLPVDVGTRRTCGTCWLRYLCGGGCTAPSIRQRNGDRGPDEWNCRSRMLAWRWTLWLEIALRSRAAVGNRR